MDLVAGVDASKYNLNFTVRGPYIGISDFIYSIENDPVLGFKIESFKLVPGGSSETLEGTFTCKNIEIENVSNSLTNNSNAADGNTTNSNTANSGTTNSNTVSNTTSGTNTVTNTTSTQTNSVTAQ